MTDDFQHATNPDETLTDDGQNVHYSVSDFDPLEDHEIGDTAEVPAAESESDSSNDTHQIELYNPPASTSLVLKWNCENCVNIFADPRLFEREPCESPRSK